MPSIQEYRVVVPFSMDELERGRQWHRVEKLRLDLMMLQQHKSEQNGLCNATYDDDAALRETVPAIPFFHNQTETPILSGEHTIMRYGEIPTGQLYLPRLLYNGLQAAIDVVITDLMILTEVESWDAFPYFSSISKNHFVGDAFKTIIEARCVPGNCTEQNALNLPDDVLSKREVVLVDIADGVESDEYNKEKDPVVFKSAKTGRGPLKPGSWMKECDPCVTCYILVSIKCDPLYFGSNFFERKLHRGFIRAMKLHYRELFCFMDSWIDLSMEDLKSSEVAVMQALGMEGKECKECSCNGNKDETNNTQKKGTCCFPNVIKNKEEDDRLQESYQKYFSIAVVVFGFIIAIIFGIVPFTLF